MTWFHWSTHQFWWSPAQIKHSLFYLKFSCTFISELMESLESCGSRNSFINIISGFGNFTTVCKSIGNKDPIQLIFISGCCLEFGTVFEPFWTNLSRYIHKSSNPPWQLSPFVSLPAFNNAWMTAFLCFQYILSSCRFQYWVPICQTPKIPPFFFFIPILWDWEYSWNDLI